MVSVIALHAVCGVVIMDLRNICKLCWLGYKINDKKTLMKSQRMLEL